MGGSVRVVVSAAVLPNADAGGGATGFGWAACRLRAGIHEWLLRPISNIGVSHKHDMALRREFICLLRSNQGRTELGGIVTQIFFGENARMKLPPHSRKTLRAMTMR